MKILTPNNQESLGNLTSSQLMMDPLIESKWKLKRAGNLLKALEIRKFINDFMNLYLFHNSDV